MHKTILFMFLIIVFFQGVLFSDNGIKPVDISSRLELFTDMWLIESVDNVELKLHPPEKKRRSFQI